jgi:WD40 repeat protein
VGAIFISHSSADTELVNELKDWLFDEHQHQSFFLDFDPQIGIPAGRDWEGELYRRLGACRAVVVLCSEASMNSRWCFAEIALARSLGKPVFPILVEPCDVVDVLQTVQSIDLAEGHDTARQRLTRALETAGLHSADLFGWDVGTGRPPYPGLVSFEEEDAGVFFGRDQEVGEGLDRLNQLRRQGGNGMLMVLGASGSGKSSLVRAGLLPRLRQDSKRWIVLTPGRPGAQPRWTIARILAEALPGDSEARAEEIRQELFDATSVEEAADSLVRAINAVRDASESSGARVLMVLDQFEELLLQDDEHPAHDFLAALRQVLDRDCGLVILATMRSDFFGEMQGHAALRGLLHSSLALGPVTHESLRQLISEPARLAGFEFEEGLVDLLLEEADSDYALPLLAFTLRELYSGYTDESSRLIRIEHYRDQLGGIEGAIRKAVDRRMPATLHENEEEALRKAFLAMARLDEKGRVRRQAVLWSEIETLMGGPEIAERLLGPFVDGLLLRPGSLEDGKRTVEVTHEAIFNNWPELGRWIRQNSEDLKLRERLSSAEEQWTRSSENEECLLTQPSMLHRALELRSEQRVPLTDALVRYIDASEVFVTRQQRLKARRRTALTAIAAVAALAMALLWQDAQTSHRKAVVEQRRAEHQVSRFLAAEAGVQGLDLALLLAVEARRAADTLEARNALAAKVFEQPRLLRFLTGHDDWVTLLASGGDGDWLVSAAGAGPAWFWNVESGQVEQVLGQAESRISTMARSADGTVLALALSDGSLMIWRVDEQEGGAALRHAINAGDRALESLAVSPDGRLVAGGARDGSVRFWDAATSAETLVPLTGHRVAVRSLAFNRDSGLLASGDAEGRLLIWQLNDEPRLIWEQAHGSDAEVGRMVFSPTDSGLLAWVLAGREEISYCRVDAVSEPAGDTCAAGGGTFTGHRRPAVDLAFSPDGTRLASGGLDDSARLWSVQSRRSVALGHDRPVESVTFVSGGKQLATGSRDHSIRLWSVAEISGSLPVGDFVDALAFDGVSGALAVASGSEATLWNPLTVEPGWSVASGDFARLVISEGLLVSGDEAGRVQAWNVATQESLGELELDSPISSLGGAGGAVVIGREDGIVGLWRPGAEGLEVSMRVDEMALATGMTLEGRLLAVTAAGELATWNVEEGAGSPSTTKLTALPVASATVSADGRTVALGMEEGEVLLWNAESGEQIELPGHPVHENLVATVVLSPDGRFLASGSSLVHVWNLATDRLEFTLPDSDEGEIIGMAFSADGETLAFGRGRHAWLVPLDPERWSERACERANRNLTAGEWRRYMPQGDPEGTCSSE